MPPDGTGERTARLGLALGGGAALGWAHIGVLRVLEAQGITPDIITGTSMGAFVGGCFAAGRLGVLEDIARSMRWSTLWRLADFKLGSSGLFGGENISEELRRELGDPLIEDLSIRFAAMASDLTTAEARRLDSGNLVDAIRASISLPGIFTPIRHQRELWVDGGMTEPLPITACRELGADLIIGVNVLGNYNGASLIRDERRIFAQKRGLSKALGLMTGGGRGPGAMTIVNASFAVVVQELIKTKLALNPPDLYVAPDVKGYNPANFDRADELIELGRAAMVAQLPRLYELMAEHGLPLPR